MEAKFQYSKEPTGRQKAKIDTNVRVAPLAHSKQSRPAKEEDKYRWAQARGLRDPSVTCTPHLRQVLVVGRNIPDHIDLGCVEKEGIQQILANERKDQRHGGPADKHIGRLPDQGPRRPSHDPDGNQQCAYQDRQIREIRIAGQSQKRPGHDAVGNSVGTRPHKPSDRSERIDDGRAIRVVPRDRSYKVRIGGEQGARYDGGKLAVIPAHNVIQCGDAAGHNQDIQKKACC